MSAEKPPKVDYCMGMILINIDANNNTHLYLFFPRHIRCWKILLHKYRQLKEEALKMKLYRKIEIKKIKVAQ